MKHFLTLCFIGLFVFYTICISAREMASYSPVLNPQLLEQLQSSKDDNRKISYTFYLHDAEPEAIKAMIAELLPQVKVAMHAPQKRLITLSTYDELKTLKLLVKECDKKVRNIKIEIQIIEISFEDLEEYKSILNQLQSGINAVYDPKNGLTKVDPFIFTFQQLITKGKVKLVSKPFILAKEYTAAKIKIGDKIPYTMVMTNQNYASEQLHHLDIGIDMILIPKVSTEGSISIAVTAAVNSIKGWKAKADNSYPILSNRSVETSVQVQNKKSAVIAGLLQEHEKVINKKNPVLTKLPIIGRWFTSPESEISKSDIAIIITPEIIE